MSAIEALPRPGRRLADLVNPRRPRAGFLPWLISAGAVALVPAILLVAGVHAAELFIGAALAGVLTTWAVRHPAGALGVTIAYTSLQTTVLAYLYKAGAPQGVVRNLGFVKEAMVAGIVIAALARHRDWKPPDLLDGFAGVYLGIATAYFLIPIAFPGSFGGASTYVRLTAWRLDCLFMVLFLAARRLPWSAERISRIRAALAVVGVVMAAATIWEVLAKSSYNNFFVDTVGVPQYQYDVLGNHTVDAASVVITGDLGGASYTRAGGLFFDSLQLSFFMLLPLGMAMERLSLDRIRSRWAVVAVFSAVGLVLTLTRSAVLGGLVGILLAPTLRSQAPGHGRKRLAVIIALVALALAPFLTTSTLRHRFASILNPGASSSQTQDNQGHLRAIEHGLSVVTRHPEGLGLGANPTTSQRYGTKDQITTENSYLQTGAELGLVPMLAFIALLFGVLVRLRRRARAPDDVEPRSGIAGGLWLAGLGLAVAGMFLHVWTSIPVALTFWGLAGVAVGQSERAADLPAAQRQTAAGRLSPSRS